MKRILTAISTALLWPFLINHTFAQGYLNPPIYSDGYIYVKPSTNVITNVTNSRNPPVNLNVLASGAITNWTINLPAPAFDGQIISIGCPGGAVTNITVATIDGSAIGIGGTGSCTASNGTFIQYEYLQPSNIWAVINTNIPGSLNNNSAITPTGATTPVTIANIAANTLLPAAYGAPANTKLISSGVVTATAGSSNVTISGASFTSTDVGKYIVIAGLGNSVTKSAAVAGGGTGNAVGDVLTLSMSGCATATKLTVTAVASGVVTSAVPTTNGSCAPASLPSNPVSVASSTGASTNATFNLTSSAASLATTIAGYTSSTQITLAANSAQTLSAVSETVAYGADDSVAINAALASGSTSLILSANATYGIANPINLPISNRIKFDCNGATIVALAPVAEMLNVPTPGGYQFHFSQGSSVDNCQLEGMGQATYNVSHGAFKWNYRNNYFLDPTASGGNLYIPPGSFGENTTFFGNEYQGNPALSGGYPQFNISVGYSDNHFTDEIASGAVNNFVDTTSGTYWTNVHGYTSLASQFVIKGANEWFENVYADSVSSYTPGFLISGVYIRLIGWHATNPGSAATNPIGVSLTTQNGYNTVSLGDFQNISPANAIVKSWNNYTGTTNVVVNNLNAQYSGIFGDSSFVTGFNAAYGAGDAIAIGPYTTVYNGGVGIGTNAVASISGSVSMGYDAGDNNSTWNSYSPSGGLSSTTGFAQHQLAVLEQTTSGSTAVRLTVDATTAAKANCAWNPNLSTMAFDVRLAVNDKTTTGKHYTAFWTAHSYTKDNGAGSTLIDGVATSISPDSTRILGTWTGASASLTADTTNGCINLSFTPPTGNTDALDMVAEIYGPQGQ